MMSVARVPDPGARREVMLVSGYLGDGGGAERQIVELATQLDRRRYSPTVVALVPEVARTRHGGHHYRRLVDAGVTVITLHKTSRAGLGQILALSRLLRSRRPAIVHSFLFSMNWRTRVAAIFVPGVRVIASERSINVWKRPWHHAFERALLVRTDAIVANADAIREFLVRTGRLPQDRIRVIHNGVDTDRFRPAADRIAARARFGFTSDDIVVGHVGTLAPHKGQSLLLSAARIALDRVPRLRVLLVGDGVERPRLLEEARRLGLAELLTMPGFSDDVPSYLHAMDVYAHMSRVREGCSNAILEAMACGLPVVATDVGGNRELVEHRLSGLLVPEEDRLAVADAIVSLATSPSSRAAMSAAARARARERFSLSSMVRATTLLYDELVGDSAHA